LPSYSLTTIIWVTIYREFSLIDRYPSQASF